VSGSRYSITNHNGNLRSSLFWDRCCVKSQKSDYLIYTAVEPGNHAWRELFNTQLWSFLNNYLGQSQSTLFTIYSIFLLMMMHLEQIGFCFHHLLMLQSEWLRYNYKSQLLNFASLHKIFLTNEKLCWLSLMFHYHLADTQRYLMLHFCTQFFSSWNLSLIVLSVTQVGFMLLVRLPCKPEFIYFSDEYNC
jgi:hypothetical protein